MLRVGLCRIIADGLGREVGALAHEKRMPLIGGRADALFGATVLELKTDLRAERADVLARLPQYLAEHERETGRRPALDIATDGATFVAYELRAGAMIEIVSHMVNPDRPDALVGRIPGL